MKQLADRDEQLAATRSESSLVVDLLKRELEFADEEHEARSRSITDLEQTEEQATAAMGARIQRDAQMRLENKQAKAQAAADEAAIPSVLQEIAAVREKLMTAKTRMAQLQTE